MEYKKALDYIDSFINFEKIPRYNYASSFKLERMCAFLHKLGNPHQCLNVIHVAGSKGKGSTCAIIAALLSQAGYKVGLYTSPHLLDVRERIRIVRSRGLGVRSELCDFEGMIEKEEFVELVEKVKPIAEGFRDHESLGKLSFFELLTACAFLYFKKKEVHFIVLETGLGGRLDATNVTVPIVCGITNISMEHTDKLGDSLGKIAKEKAGIIKDRSMIVSASQKEEAMRIIREISKEKEASLYEISRHINYSIITSDRKRQIFDLEGPEYSYKNLELNLLGRHQVENASLAIAMIKCIEGAKLDEQVVRECLKYVSWPGRLQIIRREPYVVLDGAQNVASIERVLSSIKEIFNYKRLVCVFGVSSDKDIKGITGLLDSASDTVVLTKAMTPRAKDPFYLKGGFSNSNIKVSDGVEEALKISLDIAGRDDLVLVTGSLYVVGEAIGFFKDRL